MSFFHAVVSLLIAAGAANADPVGPNGPPTNVTPYLSDPVKGWHDFTWSSGDSTAYTQYSDDNKVSIARTYSPGVTDSATGGSVYLTSADLATSNHWIRHSKNGQYSAWVAVTELA